MNITIRDACEDDYPHIRQACQEEGWSSYSRPDIEMALKNSVVLAAYAGPRFAGFVRALTDGFITIFVCELLVTEEFRRHGIGTALLRRLHERYPDARIDLISEADDFYDSLGFHKLGSGLRRRFMRSE